MNPTTVSASSRSVSTSSLSRAPKDDTSFICNHRHGQIVQVFNLHGLKVMKIIYDDVDVNVKGAALQYVAETTLNSV